MTKKNMTKERSIKLDKEDTKKNKKKKKQHNLPIIRLQHYEIGLRVMAKH